MNADDLNKIRKRWRDPDEAPGGYIAFCDANDLLDHVQELAGELTSMRVDARINRAALDTADRAIDTERRLREEYREKVALRDQVLRAVWDGTSDPAVRDVLEAWYLREEEAG